MYRVEGTDNVFRMFCKHGIATVAELRNGWSWTDTPTYYTWVERDDTIFTNPIPLLKLVCWYNPTLRIKYVEPGSYSLFIRHGLEEYYKFAGRTNLKIALFAKREGEDTPIVENKIFYDDKFLTSEEAKKNRKLDKFGNTFIFYFNTDDTYKLCNNELSLDNEEYFELVLSWFHNDLYGLNGYIIDCALLIPGEVNTFESVITQGTQM